jgi:hypothetical protein
VGVALGQPEDAVDVEAGVHARHDGDLPGGRKWEGAG